MPYWPKPERQLERLTVRLRRRRSSDLLDGRPGAMHAGRQRCSIAHSSAEANQSKAVVRSTGVTRSYGTDEALAGDAWHEWISQVDLTTKSLGLGQKLLLTSRTGYYLRPAHKIIFW